MTEHPASDHKMLVEIWQALHPQPTAEPPRNLNDRLEALAFSIIELLEEKGLWTGSAEEHHDAERIVFQKLQLEGALIEHFEPAQPTPTDDYKRGFRDGIRAAAGREVPCEPKDV
jgi:hypothetical protein